MYLSTVQLLVPVSSTTRLMESNTSMINSN